MRRIIYWRCPVCGKLNRLPKFGKQQPFEMLAEDIGGDKNIIWHREIEVDGFDLLKRQIVKILRDIADRLEGELWARKRVVKVYIPDSGLERMVLCAGVRTVSPSSQMVKTFASP